ncbi:MAG: MMPL family transporter [Chromatiaceae bacterium]|nr:MMPL family transporter [Chromatiaceae bacterium]MCP5441701.1 MMPL family transporter [Chromatiaceae bacterium]
MDRLIRFAARYPLPVVLVIGLITAAAVLKLPGLRFELSSESMMVKNDPAREFYRHVLDTFGSDKVTIIVFADPDLFHPEKLRTIQMVTAAIEALPFVERTESLFSLSHLRSVEGFVSADPYLKEVPASPQVAEKIKAEALHNPFVAANLLSDSGTALAVNVYLRANDGQPDYDARVSRGIDRLLQSLGRKLDVSFQIGSPYVRTEILEKIHLDQRRVLPLAVLVLFATLALTLRSFGGVIIPFLTAGLSVVWTLGLMAILDIPLTVMTAIVPVLLIIIGSTEDIHMIAEYQAGVRQGMQRSEAIQHMAYTMGMAVLLTFVTTYLGFLSIALNEVELLRQFGLVASTGLLINFLLTIFLVPIGLRYFGARNLGASAVTTKAVPSAGVGRILQPVLAHRRSLILMAGVIALTCAYGALSLRVSNAPLDYFERGSPVIQRVNALQEHFAGKETFSIVLSSGIEGTFLKRRYIDELRQLQEHLAATGYVGKSLSFADYIALVHSAMEELTTGDLVLPDSDDIVREYMNLIGHERVRAFVSPDYSEARIIVRHGIGDSWELGQALDKLRLFLDGSIDPGLEAHITGESILIQRATDVMAKAQAKSLGLMILVIFSVIALLFVHAKAGLVAVFPNLFPIAVLFGVMGYGEIPLDTGTAMVAAISLGICVDHTMHFMVRYHRRTRSHEDEAAALHETVRQESVPIVSASLALAFGFAALMLSGFPPVVRFGMLSALVMGLALLSTFIITPALLSSVRLITLWDLLSVRIKSQFVEQCPLFLGMRLWQIKKVVLVSRVYQYQRGDLIVRQGDPGKEMFVLLEGSAEVRMTQTDGSQKLVRMLTSGDLFGEIALVSRVARTADVVAQENCRALAFQWDGLDHVARIFPRISTRLFRNLAALLGKKLAEAKP